MSKGGDDKAGKPIPPEALKAMKHELFFGTPAPSTSGRFQKGQSGNPKGRPKRAPEPSLSLGELSINAVVARELRRLVTVREGDRVLQIPAIEALVRAQFAIATKGNAYAQRDFLDRADRVQREEAREIAEHNAFWEEYCAARRAEIAQARRKGEPEPTPLPHPDDIVIAPGKWVRFIGPVDEADAAKFDQTCRLRDTLMMQEALDQKLAITTGKTPGGALLLADGLDRHLPQRMRLGDGVMMFRLMRHEATSKRTLLKDLHQAWRSFGVTLPRGWTFPSLEHVEKRLRFYWAFIAAAQSGELDVAAMARGELDENAQEFMARWA